MPPALTQAFSGHGAPDGRPDPVFGIAVRLSADTPLREGEAEALSALLRLMAPEGSDCTFTNDLGAAREALVRHPNVETTSLLDGRVERFTTVLPLGGLPALLLLDLFHDAECLLTDAPDELILRGMPWFVPAANLFGKENASVTEGEGPGIQIFAGIVIARKGSGIHESFTVRRISYGEGVERVFPVNSPNIAQIEVDRESVPMRARLFYLRDRVGKKASKVKEKRLANY